MPDALTLMKERADRVLACRVSQRRWGDIDEIAVNVLMLAATVKFLTMPEKALRQILDEAKA